jgi:hypothetical protein
MGGFAICTECCRGRSSWQDVRLMGRLAVSGPRKVLLLMMLDSTSHPNLSETWGEETTQETGG